MIKYHTTLCTTHSVCNPIPLRSRCSRYWRVNPIPFGTALAMLLGVQVLFGPASAFAGNRLQTAAPESVVEALLQAGAQIEQQAVDGWTARMRMAICRWLRL